MFILRKIDLSGLESNISLGESYNVVLKEQNQSEFESLCKSIRLDLSVFPTCFGIIIYSDGSSTIPLYEGQQNYIMSESGKTFKAYYKEWADGFVKSRKKSDVFESIEIQNILSAFWNRKSDACPLEAQEEEKQLKEFQEWISSKNVDFLSHAINVVAEKAARSLAPSYSAAWKNIEEILVCKSKGIEIDWPKLKKNCFIEEDSYRIELLQHAVISLLEKYESEGQITGDEAAKEARQKDIKALESLEMELNY